MPDRATPTLPSRDLDVTTAFYERLGFVVSYRDTGWLVLDRGGLTLEFFPHRDLDPATSSAGCCLHLDDVDAFHAECLAAGVPATTTGWPRVHAPRAEPSGLRIGALLDPDCSLLRLVGNR